ncbi:hypothetical protein ZWY2020_033049, partial [Hordeum vulgare]
SLTRKGANEELTGISRYNTQKNRHNTRGQLEFFFFSLLSQAYDST